MKRAAIGLACAVSVCAAYGNCYDLRDSAGALLLSSPVPPFSIEWPPAGEYAASRARGERLIIRNGDCYDAKDEKATRGDSSAKTISAKQDGPAKSTANNQAGSTSTPALEEHVSSQNYRADPTYTPNYQTARSIPHVGESLHSYGGYSDTYGGGRAIYTGPRGGRYYINSHGNKTYVRHR